MAQHPGQVAGDSSGATAVESPRQEAAFADLQSQIEATRTQISQTIDAIHSRLTPGRLITDAIKEGTTERMERLVRSWRNGLSSARNAWPPANPATLPLALSGLASGMIVLKVRSRRPRRAGATLLLLGTGIALLWLLRRSADGVAEPSVSQASRQA
jgi:Protein of unknown function (DUF3618)